MGEKIMLEVTQPVVDGNEVVVAAGTLYEPGAKLPEGVTVRKVITDAPDEPKAEEKPAQQDPPKQQQSAKVPAK